MKQDPGFPIPEGTTIWYTVPGTDALPGTITYVDNYGGYMELDFGPRMARNHRIPRTRWGWVRSRDTENSFDLDPIA